MLTLIVLAKSPRPGRVKTRLCPPCSPDEAAALAEAALTDTLRAVAATPADRKVLALDGPVGPWLPAGFELSTQCTGGLDERLAHACDAATGPLLLVGMDTPQLAPRLLATCGRALAAPGVDAVLGLSHDGGWWAIGLQAADPRVFLGVPTSTPGTGATQLARLRELELVTTLLPMLRDVDTIVDALAVAAEAPGSRFTAALETIALPVR